MIPFILDQLAGEWRPQLQQAGICLEPPVQLLQSSGPAGAARKVVLLLFSGRASAPQMVLKLMRDPAHDDELQREYEQLCALHHPLAAQLLAPRPVGLFHAGRQLLLAETALPGAPLSAILQRRRPLTRRARLRLLGDYLRAAAGWLGRFQDSGPQTRTTFAGRAALLPYLERLPDDLLPDSFPALLAGEADRFQGLALPLVNAHGDFWPGNLLFDERRALCGVNDWEAFQPQCLPTFDLFHFLATFLHGSGSRGSDRARREAVQLATPLMADFFARRRLPLASAPLFYALFLLQMAAPAPEAGCKRRQQAGPWREMLRAYAHYCTQDRAGRAPGLRLPLLEDVP